MYVLERISRITYCPWTTDNFSDPLDSDDEHAGELDYEEVDSDDQLDPQQQRYNDIAAPIVLPRPHQSSGTMVVGAAWVRAGVPVRTSDVRMRCKARSGV